MERVAWVDIAKGIGIILVVFGHINFVYDIDYDLIRVVYMFHIPLFFFISGYLYKKNTDIKKHIKNKFYQLMVPYFASLFLIAPFSSLFREMYSAPDITLGMVTQTIGKLLFGGCYLHDEIGILWFLPVLFLTQIVYNVLCNKFKNQDVHLIVLLLLMVAYFCSFRFAKDQLVPFNAHIVMGSLAIFHIGHIYKSSGYKENIILVVILSVISVISIKYYPDNIFSMRSGYYGYPLFTLFCSITMILLVKNISILISKNTLIAKPFILLGRESLVIMCFHMLVLLNIGKCLTTNPFIVVASTLAITYFIAVLFDKFALTRFLFKGKKSDIKAIEQKP